MEELSEEQVTDGERWDVTTCLLRESGGDGGRSVNFEFNGLFDRHATFPSLDEGESERE